MANTTWNPSDKSVGITLCTGNLTAKNNNNAVSGVRAIAGQPTGKFYWEYSWDATTSASDGVGVAILTFPLISIGNSASGASGNFTVNRVGTVIRDGGTVGVGIGTLVNGTIVCIAIDLTGRLGWFRSGAAGLWNNAGTANPATGVGGIAVTTIGSGISAYPVAAVNNTNDQITANFGDSAFVGVVPAGFTGGAFQPAASASQARAMMLA